MTENNPALGNDGLTWSRMRRDFIRSQFPAFLDALGYSTAAAVGAYLLFQVLLRLLNAHFKSLPFSPSQIAIGIALAAGGVILLAGLGVAIRKQLSHWVDEWSV